MKMPENMTRWPPFLAAKEQGIGAIPGVCNGVPRGRYNGGAFTKTVIDATMCAIIVITVILLKSFRLAVTLGEYNERVYRLHRY